MTRSASKVAEPHRVLKLDRENPQRGEDVRALQAAAKRRLDARGIVREFEVDGVLGPKTVAALDTAIWALGALQSTVSEPELSVGAQRLVRYPGRRSPEQLARAAARMDDLERDRARKHVAPGSAPGVSGLPAAARAEARDRAVAAMRLLFDHAAAVHYTQAPRRWEGIARGMRAADGAFPRYADCSSATSWALWNALTGVGGMDFPDVVNGQDWKAGYTGTQLTHGKSVALADLLPGDLVIYGHGWPGVHVAMYAGGGLVYSHGSEAGPFHIAVRYRTDIMAARRYI